MKSRLNRAFTLIEVLITVAILSSAIIFVFRSFATALTSVKFSQDLTRACYLAEDKLWEINQYSLNGNSLPEQGSEDKFRWEYEISPASEPNLEELKLNVYWKKNKKESDYSLQFSTYLAK